MAAGLVELGDEYRRLGAAFHAQLGQQPGHVVFDRLLGEEHPGRDLLVGQAFAEQVQQYALLGAESRQRVGVFRGPVYGPSEIQGAGGVKGRRRIRVNDGVLGDHHVKRRHRGLDKFRVGCRHALIVVPAIGKT